METKNVIFTKEPKEMVYSRVTKEPKTVLAEGIYRGFPFMIINISNRFPCTYVKCNDINATNLNDYPFEPHGGITFVGYGNNSCCLPEAEEGKVWVGWDYMHFGDFIPFGISSGHMWTTKELIEDMKNTIDNFYNTLGKEEIICDNAFDDEKESEDKIMVAIIYKHGSKLAAKRRQAEENHKKKILSTLHSYYNGYYDASECHWMTQLNEGDRGRRGIRKSRGKITAGVKPYKRYSKKKVRYSLNKIMEDDIDISKLGKGIMTKMYITIDY